MHPQPNEISFTELNLCVCVYCIPLCSVYISISAYLASGKTPDTSSQLEAFWPCSGVENVSALSGEDGIEEATKRGMSGSKLRKNTERQNRLRPPTAVACQIGGIGGGSSLICLFVRFVHSLVRVQINY